MKSKRERVTLGDMDYANRQKRFRRNLENLSILDIGDIVTDTLDVDALETLEETIAEYLAGVRGEYE